MSNSSGSGRSGGMGLGTILFIVFLVLKLTGNIGWSWWWVTSPLWIPALISLSLFALAGLILGYAEYRQSRKGYRHPRRR